MDIEKKLNKFLKTNLQKIIYFLSAIVKIKSYSNCEKELVKFITNYINHQKLTKNSKIKIIKNNLILLYAFSNHQDIKLLYDAHLDTVPAEHTEKWLVPPFSGKFLSGKIYGRGSCDDKGSITSLIFCFLFLNKFQIKTPPLAFSFSSNEEDSSAKGIEEILKYTKPRYCIICEPSDLKIVYGHKGKWSVKLTFLGKTSHSSLPHLGKNAIYLGYPLIKKLIETKNKNFKPSILGEPVYTITYIESKTNSLNSLPYECSIYIDYRSVLGETENSIKNYIVKNLKNFKFQPLHRFFKAWVLDENHNLLKLAKEIYQLSFKKEAKPILWQFCTNGSITMANYNIPTIGFGPGNPFLAHQDNEHINIKDVLEAIKFYVNFSLYI